MKTTPVYGWPYADDTDPVKQFPTVVDAPRTLAIEQSLSTHIGRDTGWRDMAGVTVNGFTASLVRLRRTGWSVTLFLYELTRAAAVTTPPVAALGTAPEGFKLSSQAPWAFPRSHLVNIYSGSIMAGSWAYLSTTPGQWLMVATIPANGRIYETFTYPTNDPWPTTLPGSPASATKPAAP